MSNELQQVVYVVDDDAAVRDSIQELVESVGLRAQTYPSAAAFLATFRPERPGCLVLDVRMADMSGLELQKKLSASGVTIPIVMITGHADVPMAVHALKAGAVDFVQKPYRDQLLLDSINAALAMNTAARRSAAVAERFHQRLAKLTEREREVFDHVKAGRTSKDIARELGISPRTAEVHRRNLLHKLGTTSVKDLVVRLKSLERSSQDH
jgi:two-component system response regulator DctR